MLFAGCTTATTTTTTPTGTTTETPKPAASALAAYFVSAADLKANLAGTIVIDARADKDYAAGHIPGSINAIWQAFAKVTAGKPGDKGWGTLNTPAEIAKTLGDLGVDTSKPIVVVTAPGGWGEDGRIVWMLRMAGITNSRMLDGGYTAWTAAGYEVSTDATKLPATTVTIASLDQSWNVTTDEIVAGLSTLKIIDARTVKEYNGAVDFGEARGGHVPGAINIPFGTQFNDDGKIKSESDLKALFTAAGISPTDNIVVYCTKGIRSAHMTLVLRALGYNSARNYDASYYEWAGNKTLQVVK
jgi:thiosulfate/3-mercaptopyruvate sulfurtransferase